MKTLISPSVLASDFSKLGEEIIKIDRSGADMVHLDVMDGHFVPNISFGPSIIKSVRGKTNLFFDAHLMISDPYKYLDEFKKAGVDGITIHLESYSDEKMVEKTLKEIKNLGLSPGISIKPDTDEKRVFKYLDILEMILVMSVEPGFGGQLFQESSLEKIRKIREKTDSLGKKDFKIQVDGGIDESTAKKVVEAGANVLVAGTSIFKQDNYKDAIDRLRIAKG